MLAPMEVRADDDLDGDTIIDRDEDDDRTL